MKRTAFAPLVLPVCLFASVAGAQWSTPVGLANVNSTATDFDVAPTVDGLTIYFSTTLTGNYEIFRATRATRYGAFTSPMQVTELADPGTDVSPWPRVDHLELFFCSTRVGGMGSNDLWRADRPSTSVPFNAPVPVTELNTTTADITPTLTIDGLRMYFASSRPGGAGSYDIYTATRPNWNSPFGTATPVMELNTASSEYTPCISPEGLTIFFASNRPGGLGGDDIWMASRLDTASPFGNIVNVTALNTVVAEQSPAFALFHDEVFFGSSRPGGLGSSDLYSTRFTGLVSTGIAGVGSVMDLRFSDPSSPGKVYVAISSRGTTPGIPIDTRRLPLNFDLLFQLTVGGLPPVLTGYVGALSQDGIGSGRISFANFPQFVGFKFFTAFVVLDPPAPSGVKTISNAHEVQVQ